MNESIVELPIHCPHCLYRFPAEAESTQCPSCEAELDCSACSKPTQPLNPAELEEIDRQVQRRGEILWLPINQNRDHRAMVWIDHVGNGLFEDDYSKSSWLIPHRAVYRFTRQESAAYIWQVGVTWFVRGWHPLKEGASPPAPVEVETFRLALDELVEKS
jgi:hypothetical protein